MQNDLRQSRTSEYLTLIFETIQAHSLRMKCFMLSLITLALAASDFITGYELSFSLFYIIPISFAAWFISLRLGFFFCFFCAGLWGTLDILSGQDYSSSFYMLWNPLVRLGFFVVTVKLLEVIKIAFAKERSLSQIDFLTGLYNRRFIHEIVDRELSIFKRSGRNFVLVYIDLDNFKKVNDSKGHLEGDNVLVSVAQIMRQKLRRSDFVSRIGGDEFLLVLPDTDFKQAQFVIDNLKKELDAGMQSHEWPITFSMGVLSSNSSFTSVNEVIRTVDDLMYKVKYSTKNSILYQAA